jgi:hypothetical protein
MMPGPGELGGLGTVAPPGAMEPVVEEAEYLELRRRIHDVVKKLIPGGSTVLVVSKGDDELVRFEDREGWHFPRTSAGQYGGYHPADAVAAISHLEELRAAGADYFVLPTPYLWWLDHYPELAEHLQSRYRLVTDRPDSCLIYHLNEPPLGTPAIAPPAIARETRPHAGEPVAPMQLIPPVRQLLESVVEPEAGVLVVSGGADEWLELGRNAWHFPQDATGRYVPIHRSRGLSMLAQLDSLRDRGAWYLLVPSTSFTSVERSEELVRYLRRCRLVALRERVCALFELAEASGYRGRRSGGERAAQQDIATGSASVLSETTTAIGKDEDG